MEWVRALIVMSRMRDIAPGDTILVENGIVMFRACQFMSSMDFSEIGIYRK